MEYSKRENAKAGTIFIRQLLAQSLARAFTPKMNVIILKEFFCLNWGKGKKNVRKKYKKKRKRGKTKRNSLEAAKVSVTSSLAFLFSFGFLSQPQCLFALFISENTKLISLHLVPNTSLFHSVSNHFISPKRAAISSLTLIDFYSH